MSTLNFVRSAFAIGLFAICTHTACAQSPEMRVKAAEEFKRSARGACLPGYPCFIASAAYPQTLPPPESYPWDAIDYKTNQAAFMQAVLGYVIEGNTEVDWDITKNIKRSWYHAPWMHGEREVIHGMTRERGNRWHELSGNQIRRTNNWAVGFYNAPGGFGIGKVWKDQTFPNSKDAAFPVGTVTAKLLFSDATDDEAPYLKSYNNLAWDADINNNGNPVRLRLLQMDVAVKTAASVDFSGWVFGTFVYDANQKKPRYWENLVPVGLEWGSSPSHTYTSFTAGKVPAESWVNPAMLPLFESRPPDMRLGYLGRMNGPVDSPLSSCLSCHSRALDSVGKPSPAFTPSEQAMCLQRFNVPSGNESYRRISNCTVNEAEIEPYYRNLKSDEPFIPGRNSLDYSLQLTLGIVKWHEWYKRSFPTEYATVFPSATPAPGVLSSAASTSSLKLKKQKAVSIPMVPASEAFDRGD